MSEERSQFARQIDEHTFSLSRRGYDRTEVKSYLQDLEQAFRELEGHSRRQAQKLADLERDVSQARATEKVSVDNAMLAVFDAKDRILERARRKAEEIEDDAHLEAGRIREAALREAGGGEGAAAGEIAAARVQADEIVASARREADRLRDEVAPPSDAELEAELADMGSRLRRAHDETAAARDELDGARKRIVELESRPAEQDDLTGKFAELELLVSDSREEATRLAGELESERAELQLARDSAARAEQELLDLQSKSRALETDLGEAKAKVAEIERSREEVTAKYESAVADAARTKDELDSLRTANTSTEDDQHRLAEARRERDEFAAKLADSEADKSAVAATLDEAEQTRKEIMDRLVATERERDEVRSKLRAADEARTATEQPTPGDDFEDESEQAAFARRMATFQTRMAGVSRRANTLGLLTETRRIGGVATAAVVPDGSAIAAAAGEAQQLLEEARAEAEEITAEAEEQAEQRAAKVIAKAREEADQVRQTVSTLTAQAEDARSAALRSKLEAEDLAEAQRAMRGARDDIVHTAESRAAEIRADAERDAAALRAEAEEELRRAREEAQRIGTSAEARPEESKSPRDSVQADAERPHDPVAAGDEPPQDLVAEDRELPDDAVPVAAEPPPIVFGGELRATSDTADDMAESGVPNEPAEGIAAVGADAVDKVADAEETDELDDFAVATEEAVPGEPDLAAETIEPDEAGPADGGDDLAALLAAAEQDLAAGEELRKQRQQLDEQEAELAAQQAETAMLFASTRDTASYGSDPNEAVEPIEDEVPLTATSGPSEPYSFDIAVEEQTPPTPEDEEEEDPAERLSALLEEVAPTVAESEVETVDFSTPSPDMFGPFVVDEPEMKAAVDESKPSADLEDSEQDEPGDDLVEHPEADAPAESVVESPERSEPAPVPQIETGDPGRPRVAWPSPVGPGSSSSNGDKPAARPEDDGDLDGETDSDRQSRYSSHSAQLPRLGKQAQSSSSAMASLRKKGRGKR